MKNYLLYTLLMVCLAACSQKSKPRVSNLTSENYVETMLKSIKRYDYEPMYYLTFEQTACFSEILVNDIPLHKNFQKELSGRTFDINHYIFKSGIQKVTFRLYPAGKIWERDLSKFVYDTEMKIEISEYDNAKRDQAEKKIVNYITPTVPNNNVYGEKEFIGIGKTYYEASFTFEAKVPYEFPSLDNENSVRFHPQLRLEATRYVLFLYSFKLIENFKNENIFR